MQIAETKIFCAEWVYEKSELEVETDRTLALYMAIKKQDIMSMKRGYQIPENQSLHPMCP